MNRSLITPQAADLRLCEVLAPAPVIACPLEGALGRTLREPIVADRDLPPCDRVMMDGYALRGRDLACAHWDIQGRQLAGDAPLPLDAQPGHVVEVMTGAVLPLGAELVVPYEWTTRTGERRVSLNPDQTCQVGQFIHAKGVDATAGAELVMAGSRLGPVEMAMAAACGYTEVKVSQLPRIQVFSTGDEVIPVEATPTSAQVRCSNRVAIVAALRAAGFPVGYAGHLSDERKASAGLLQTAWQDSEVVVLSGGISRGAVDWIPEELNAHCRQLFHGVAQRPGKPMGVWQAPSGAMVFALPGNPLSTLVGVYRYLLPWLGARQGGAYRVARQRVVLAASVQPAADSVRFVPVALNGEGEAVPCSPRNSGDFAGLRGTSGWAVLEVGQDSLPAGTPVSFIPWNLQSTH